MNIGFIVLCGGKGTRIKKELQGLPKILAPIGEKTGLDYILEWINCYKGEKNIYLCTGHLSDKIETYIKHNNMMDLQIIKEKKQRGTLECINNTIEMKQNDFFLVMNGDTLVSINPGQIIASAIQKRSKMMLTLVPSKQSQYSICSDRVVKAKMDDQKQTYKSTGLLWVKKCYWDSIKNEIEQVKKKKKNSSIDDLLMNIDEIDPLLLEKDSTLHDYGTTKDYMKREYKFKLIMEKIALK